MARKHLPALAMAVLAASLFLVGGGSVLAQPPPPYMGDYDLNGDQQFTALDLGVFYLYWEQYKVDHIYNASGDFNHDGVIDWRDARMIIEEWLQPFPHIHPSSVTAAKVSAAAATSKADVSTTSAAPSDAVAAKSSSTNLNSTTVSP